MKELKKLNPIDVLAILFILSSIAVIILEYFKIDFTYVLDLKYIKFSINGLLVGACVTTFIVVAFLVLTPVKFDDLRLMEGFKSKWDSHPTAYRLTKLCFYTQTIFIILLSVPSNGREIFYREVLFQFYFYLSPTLFFLFTTLFLKYIKKQKLVVFVEGFVSVQFAGEELKSDKEFILEAIKKYGGRSFQFASEKLKSDREFVFEAVKQDVQSLKYASNELKANKEFVLEAIKYDGNSIQFVSDELRANRFFIKEVVKIKGFTLQYLSDELKADKEIVLEAVNSHGIAIEYASDELKYDKDIVLNAISTYGSAIQFTSGELQNDKEIILKAVKQNGYSLQFASDELKADKEVVLEAVKENAGSFQYASQELLSNKDFSTEIENLKFQVLADIGIDEDTFDELVEQIKTNSKKNPITYQDEDMVQLPDGTWEPKDGL